MTFTSSLALRKPFEPQPKNHKASAVSELFKRRVTSLAPQRQSRSNVDILEHTQTKRRSARRASLRGKMAQSKGIKPLDSKATNPPLLPIDFDEGVGSATS
ncbi:MAG: hypothetical protein Q9221_008743 [Calogaya cf. arnoldii]